MENNKIADIPVIPSIENFLASSVHDMKNSVSILIGGLNKALVSVDPSSFPGYEGLVQMSHEAKRINTNLVQLLTLYKLGQQIYLIDPQTVSLEEFIQTIVAQNFALLESRNITLTTHVENDLYWYFDEDLISSAVNNALNNAIRYAKNRINIIAKEKNGQFELRLEDDGPGFPDAVMKQSINYMRSIDFQSGNTGLGLYFSTMATRLHNNHSRHGDIKLENGGSLGGGCFILHLP